MDDQNQNQNVGQEGEMPTQKEGMEVPATDMPAEGAAEAAPAQEDEAAS